MFEEWVKEAVSNLGLESRQLAGDEADEVWCTLAKRYSDGDCERRWLWDCSGLNAFSYHDPEGGQKIGDYVGGDPCILISAEDGPTKAFEMPSGEALATIVYEVSLDEFCVTDRACSYLLCFNHHEFLIGFGHTIPWVVARGVEAGKVEQIREE